MIICVLGKSNAGKTVFADYLTKKFNIDKVVTTTTRAPRKGEVKGVHYHFLTKEEAEQQIKEGRYVEYDRFNSNIYGCRYEDFNLDKNSIIVITPAGYRALKKAYGEAVIGIYINPPFFTRLGRIIKRDKGNYKKAFGRYFADAKAFKNMEEVIEIKKVFKISGF